MYIRYILTLLLSFLFLLSSAQPFTRNDTLPVIVNSQKLKNAWVGGFNNPQFSDIDLNGDGIIDLFVFDRSGNKIYTFINGGTTNEVDYKHAPEYQSQFPYLYSWVLLVDYNGDDKKDIFTSSYYGVRVYRNDYTATDGLQFTLVSPELSTTINSVSSLLWVSEWDIPAITDVDGDGDIDILSYELFGSTMQYYKNLSMETYGIPDSLLFDLEDTAWGGFEESFTDCSIELKSLHAGSTTLALDLDCDSDMEVIIGDITCYNVTQLTNGGNKDSAHMTAMDLTFPANYPVHIRSFPATFHVDVNNDGLKDLLFSPNAIDISDNFKSAWYYKNTGSNCAPLFTFETDAFLQEEMIEVGAGANPVFFDYDKDGLLDIVVGNYGYYSDTGYNTGLSLYQNAGTPTNPAFTLITRNYANVFSQKLYGVYPAFGDVDGDNDQDMFIGDAEGKLHYYENIANTDQIANFVLQQVYYDSIDVGKYCSPQLVDVNRDGLLDLLIGERGGNINYYQNIGTATTPSFTLINGSLGMVNVIEPEYLTGYSTPFLTALDSNCNYDLLVGSESGKVYHYTSIDNNLSGSFTLIDSTFGGIYEGERASISMGDINNDSTLDMVVGNNGGGIAIYMNNKKTLVCPPPPDNTYSVSIYPNPAGELLNIKIYCIWDKKQVDIYIYNLLGQLLYFKQVVGGSSPEMITINTKTISQGLYICKIISNEEQIIQKIVVAK